MRRAIAAGATGVAAGAAVALAGRPYVGLVLAVAAAVVTAAAVVAAHPRAHRFVPALVPLGLAAVVSTIGRSERGYAWSVDHGDPGLDRWAVLLAAAGAVLAVLVLVGVDVARAIERIGRAVGEAVGTVASGAVYLLLVLPASAWSRLRHRTIVRSDRPPGWLPVSAGPDAPGAGRRRSRLGQLSWAAGGVVLIVALDYGLGWAWDDTHRPAAAPSDEVVSSPDQEPLPPDPRADLPSMAAYPWREQYFDDIRRPTMGYWPFTETRPRSYRSRYVNLDGWTRRTLAPAGEPDDVATIWLFGGSATWGEGQRDDHTIASELVRLADGAGTPVRVVNYGQRGWTHLQEMVLLDQLLAEEPAPDLAVFYDGANEVSSQTIVTEPAPSHPLAFSYAQRLGGASVATEAEAPADGTTWDDLWRTYRRHSLLARVARTATGEPASADDEGGRATGGGAAGPADDDGYTDDPHRTADGSGWSFDLTDQDGIDAGRVYARSQRLTRAVADSHGVGTAFFWQPTAYDVTAYQRARDALPEGTVDLHTALADHPEVYIDDVHTNEEGARLVAGAMWDHLADQVRELDAGG